MKIYTVGIAGFGCIGKVHAYAHLQNGSVGAIEANKTATGTENELRFELHGSAGEIRLHSMQPHHLQVYDAGIPDKVFGSMKDRTLVDCGQRYPESHFPGPKFSIGWMRAHVTSLYSFLDKVSKGSAGKPGSDASSHPSSTGRPNSSTDVHRRSGAASDRYVVSG